MNRFRHVLILFVLIGAAFFGCKKGTIDYSTIGIKLEHHDNSGAYLVPAGSSVNDSAYVLRINYVSDSTGFFAVDDNNSYRGLNKPTAIEITSFQNFDSLHPANSLLNDLFIAGPAIGSSANDIISNFADTKDYYPTHEPDDLWLMNSPQNSGLYIFVVKMTFDDGRILRDTTSSINLVP